MDMHRKIAIFVGILILLAYALLGSNNPNEKAFGMVLEIISAVAVLSIAILMYPLFMLYNKELARWYFGLKWIEALMLVITGILFYIHTPELLTLRENIYSVHTYVFVVSALMFYYMLYKLQLIPKWLSLWGMIATLLLMIVNLLEMNGLISQLPLLYLPIVLNEVILALWLIFKGFNDE
ncbi:MAG: DUF4386 domain-containing protein [Sulfurovum sp.]|nr:DUF4386 domain-containing protein [Sulfurovum sp.]